jgi:uncharacterized protein (TIGR00730 family)
MEVVGVFCGDQPGTRPEYAARARDFGRALARRGVGLVCGVWGEGASAAVAEAAWESGGRVGFVTPRQLYRDGMADRARGEIYLTDSMDGCKSLIYEMATCLVILPGGFWTLGTLIEAALLSNLKILQKPIFVVNHEGFFQSFIALLDDLSAEGFLSAGERSAVYVTGSYDEALDLVFRRGQTGQTGQSGEPAVLLDPHDEV